MSSSNAKKTMYCGWAFVGAVGLAVVLWLFLPFVYVKEGADLITASGIKFLIGLFGGVKGTRGGSAVELGTLVNSPVFLYMAAVLSIAFLVMCCVLLFFAVRQQLKKQNVVNAPHFYVFMVITLFVTLTLFALGMVIAHQIAGAFVITPTTTSWFWVSLVLIIGVDILAHEFLQKFEYDAYEQQPQKEGCGCGCGNEETTENESNTTQNIEQESVEQESVEQESAEKETTEG